VKEFHFIEAASPGAHVFSAYPIPRLGTLILAAMLKARGYKTKVHIEDVARPDWKALDRADIVGISAITPTAMRAYRLADRYRAKGKVVVMGGPHVTFMPDEALAHADYVVRGEGEETLPELMDALEGRLSFYRIKGLSWHGPAGNRHNPDRELVTDLDVHPAPDFSLVHGWRDRGVVPVATSRGCPFDCKFCSVIRMFGRKYRFKSVDRVLDELGALPSSNPFVFFVDDNFTANRERTKELLRRMMDEGLKFEWSAQVRSDTARDPELLRLMKSSDCHTVYIGLESINPATLKAFNKAQGLADMDAAVRAFKANGIKMHGMFVVGSDTDDVHTIRGTEQYARRMGLESVQFMMLTPLPGTPVYEEMKQQGRLLHTDWSRYDAQHVVFRPRSMTPWEFQRETLKAMARFYSWRTILRRFARLKVHEVKLGLYGKYAVRSAFREGERYLKEMAASMNMHAAGRF